MGCCSINKRTKIVAMKTVHQDEVFTSTTNIRSIYTFEKILGHGSFGSVKLARHIINNQQVAIKIIEKSKLKGKESVLATEIFILQNLDHPNIIKFHEVYQDELFLYICMENCSGGELLERIAHSNRPLNEGKVQIIISKVIKYTLIINKILSAISYIHDQGIVHRDIKPENIMFSDKSLSSDPKLIDFGLSNKFDTKHLKRLKTFVGTPLYLPPEIITGEYDEKCDMWSLGVLLYVLLCGYAPFAGRSRQQLFYSIQNSQVNFDKPNWKNLTDNVKDLIKGLLQKTPTKRFSAKEAQQHPWFKMKFSTLQQEKSTSKLQQTQLSILKSKESEENKHILDMLRNFRNGAKFKKEVKKVLINQMNEIELQKLKVAFQRIDVDNSGTITFEELEKAMIEEGFQTSAQEIEKLMLTISLERDDDVTDKENDDDDDVDDDYKQIPPPAQTPKNRLPIVIKYSDFLAAAIDERKIFTKEKLWSLFKYFDTEGANSISRDDIQEAFARHGRHIPSEQIDIMIQEIDPNHDGKISFEEFCAMMGVEGIEKTLDIKD